MGAKPLEPTWPNYVSLNLEEPLEVLEPLHLVVQVPQRGLLALQDLVDDALLSRVLCLCFYFLEEKRDLHDMMDRRHQQVCQLELLTPGVFVTPLTIWRYVNTPTRVTTSHLLKLGELLMSPQSLQIVESIDVVESVAVESLKQRVKQISTRLELNQNPGYISSMLDICPIPALDTPAAPGLCWNTEDRIFTTGRSPSRETF